MEKTLVVVVTHRGISDETRECLNRLKCPSLAVIKGIADISRARSIAFDQALAHTDDTPIDAVLCIDDDMVFHPENAAELVNAARERGAPCSGVCLTRDGTIAARRHGNRFLTGIAFMAMPLTCLRELAPKLRNLGGTRTWCQSGEHPEFPGAWLSEDFWFCLHFGGVELVNVCAGHVKRFPMWPDPASAKAAVESVLK